MLKFILAFALDRLKERSTWLGVIGLATAAGVGPACLTVIVRPPCTACGSCLAPAGVRLSTRTRYRTDHSPAVPAVTRGGSQTTA